MLKRDMEYFSLRLGLCFTPHPTTLNEDEQLFPHWEGSVSSNCRIFADPYAVSSALKVVEFPDESILPIGFNITISCTSNRSKSYPGYTGQPYWIQIYRNDRLLHDCGGRDGAVDSEDFKECQFVIVNATSQNSGIYDCWSWNQVTCTESNKINLTFQGKFEACSS